MSKSHRLLKLARTIHLYLGLFTSPALIFFAFTGALQSVNLHETTQGSSYKPPAWLTSLAQLHKKQTTVVPVRRPRPEGFPTGEPGTAGGGARAASRQGAQAGPGVDTRQPANAGAGAQTALSGKTGPAGQVGPGGPPKGHWPMKIFFVVVSLGLFVSTVTGVYLSYRYSRKPWVVTAWLAAGVVLPLLLLPF